jgi:predicted dehydrogenase
VAIAIGNCFCIGFFAGVQALKKVIDAGPAGYIRLQEIDFLWKNQYYRNPGVHELDNLGP